MKTYFNAWLPAVAWAAFIYALSSMPARPGSAWAIPHVDKLAHALLFGILALLLFRSLHLSFRVGLVAKVLLAAALASLYGLTDEFHQAFTPGRDVDPFDWVADTAGAVLAAGCAGLYLRRRGARPAPSLAAPRETEAVE